LRSEYKCPYCKDVSLLLFAEEIAGENPKCPSCASELTSEGGRSRLARPWDKLFGEKLFGPKHLR
jgi:hypothetical protein